MEQLAEPGTTYVTENTFKLTEGFFRFEDLENLKKAETMFREMGMDHWLAKAQKALARL
jgi:hypothetical protein